MKSIIRVGMLAAALLLSDRVMAQGAPPANGGVAPPGSGMQAGGPGAPPPGAPGMTVEPEVDHSKECNSQCLRTFADQYLAALAANDISMLKVNPNLRVSENSHAIALGDNSWKTIQKIRPEKLVFTDPFAGQVLIMSTAEMGAAEPFMYSVRLKVEGGKLSESETMIASQRNAGMHFRPDLLTEAATVLDATVSANQRMARADLLKAARIAWGQDAGTALPVAKTCQRYENWEAGAEPCRAGGAARAGARNSRIPLVDVEKGVVVNYQLQDSPNPGGRRESNSATPVFYYQPLTFYVMQLAKISGGEIQGSGVFMSLQELYVGGVFPR